MFRRAASIAFVVCLFSIASAEDRWKRHAIEGKSLRGADGVRLADFNADGLADIVSGWEQSGIVRLYLNPGPKDATGIWPAVTVGQTASPEDAVPIDVDGDGKIDVVSCHEGKARKLLVHFNRAAGSVNADLLKPSNWQTAEFTPLAGQAWMFAAPLGLRDDRAAIVAGSKGSNASITLLVAPQKNKAGLSGWRTIRLRDAGWIMSLRCVDMDADGDRDILFSDRKGKTRRVGWLEQPSLPAKQAWTEHSVGGEDYEVMFIDAIENQGKPPEILVSTRNAIWIRYRHVDGGWTATEANNPPSVDHGKAISQMSPGEIIMTANTGGSQVPGIWYQRNGSPWQAIDTPPGGKFDRIELLDLNGDGFTDALTCEERQNHGVIWYENPGE